MELSGIVPIKTLAFHGGAASVNINNKTQKAKTVTFDSTKGGKSFCVGRCSVRAVSAVLDDGFCDEGHVEYYRDEKKKGVMKKKLKLLKGLAKRFDMFGELEICDDVEGHTISEAKVLLLKQLEQLKVEEKAMKKRRKQEKAKLKADRMKTKMGCESSSKSSSSSSESECGEVVNLRTMRSKVLEKPIGLETLPVTLDSLQPMVEVGKPMLKEALVMHQEPSPSAVYSLPTQAESIMKESGFQDCTSGVRTSISPVVGQQGMLQKRIEVCMGGKCKKSGAGSLLEELGRAMGEEGAVVGCKCMGKCKNGPNVRVVHNEGGIHQSKAMNDSSTALSNPLYMGVNLDDVSVILSSFFEDGNDMRPSLAAA